MGKNEVLHNKREERATTVTHNLSFWLILVLSANIFNATCAF